jgi:AraC-like DNA-binding protein
MGAERKLPFSLFSTEHLPPRDQFDAWHESISVLFDIAPLPERPAESGFAASVRAYHLGGLIVSQVDFEGQRFLRDKHRAAADGLDHYVVQLYATGGLVDTAENRERILRAGDVQILDLSQPNVIRAEASGTIAIVVPRDTLRQALPKAGDLHGLVLRGDQGTGALLTDYMRSLIARADDIAAADAPAIARATTEMIAACFHATAEPMAHARTAIEAVTLERIRRHVAAALGSPELHPEALCGLFRISRTQLYRLFEPLGGVAAYIQEQRLGRAYAQLSDATHGQRRIYDIAFDLGFSSEAHFSRIFRRAFGLSPSEVRARAREVPPGDDGTVRDGATASGGYEDWVRRLRSA